MDLFQKMLGIKIGVITPSYAAPWVIAFVLLVIISNADLWPTEFVTPSWMASGFSTIDVENGGLTAESTDPFRFSPLRKTKVPSVELLDGPLDIYRDLLHDFKSRHVTMVIAGVNDPATLSRWKKYLGVQSRIFGLYGEPNVNILQNELENITILYGDIGNVTFLEQIRQRVGSFDILIDAVGQQSNDLMDKKIKFFKELYRSVSPDGVYLCLNPRLSTEVKLAPAFTNFAKTLIDQVELSKSCQSTSTECSSYFHVSDGILIIRK